VQGFVRPLAFFSPAGFASLGSAAFLGILSVCRGDGVEKEWRQLFSEVSARLKSERGIRVRQRGERQVVASRMRSWAASRLNGGKYWPWPSRRDDATTATTGCTRSAIFCSVELRYL
jgi:hypothetical protein